MARPTIPPAVLAQRGVPITLIDGTEVRICYTFRSLIMIEDEFGSLQRALNALDYGDNPDAKAFASICTLVAAGLQHEVAGPDGTQLGHRDVVADYLDTQQVQEIGEAIGKAITNAFPAKTEAAEEDADQPDPTLPSPGSTGSTSAASSGSGATPTSSPAHRLSSVPS